MEWIINNENATVNYSSSLDLVLLRWKKQPNTSTYREVFNIVLDTIERHRACAIISDISKSGVVDPEDRKWLESEIIPKALEAGLHLIATVMEENVYKKYYVKRIHNELDKGGVSLKIFGKLEDAVEWIAQAESQI